MRFLEPCFGISEEGLHYLPGLGTFLHHECKNQCDCLHLLFRKWQMLLESSLWFFYHILTQLAFSNSLRYSGLKLRLGAYQRIRNNRPTNWLPCPWMLSITHKWLFEVFQSMFSGLTLH